MRPGISKFFSWFIIVVKWVFWIWLVYVFAKQWKWNFVLPLAFAVICGALIRAYFKRIPSSMVPAVAAMLGGIFQLFMKPVVLNSARQLLFFDLIGMVIILICFVFKPDARRVKLLAGGVLAVFLVDVYNLISYDIGGWIHTVFLIQIVVKLAILGLAGGGLRRMLKREKGGA